MLSAVLIIGKITKERKKADGPEDDIPVGVKEIEDRLGSVRAQVKAIGWLGDNNDESNCSQHGDGEE